MTALTDRVFKALSDPTRRALFERLIQHGDQTVRALTDTGTVSQPMVSKHLSVLGRARLVSSRRHGRETHYRARPEALAPLAHWMTHYAAFWQKSFDQLGAVLERMDP